jgi:HEAT repeat protein
MATKSTKEIEALKANKDAATLIALSQDRGKDQSIRMEALAAIDEIVAPASFVILAFERGYGKDTLYKDMAENLGGVGYVRIINHLASLLADPATEIKGEAAKTLGHVCSKRVVDPLVHALETDNDLAVQFSAILALNNLFYKCRDVCNPTAERKLIDLLDNKFQDDVEAEIADTLGALRTENAIPALIKTLDHINWRDRHDIDWVLDGRKSALVMIGAAAVEPLIQALENDPDMSIKIGAVWVLGEIRDKRALTPLKATLAKITVAEADDFLLKEYVNRALHKIEQRQSPAPRNN